MGAGAGAARAIGAITPHLMKAGLDAGASIPVTLPLWAVVGAFLFSAFLGILFGLYPAARAARLDPIQALRHEA
jgi:putative ABC transport system permease protein